MPSCFYSDMTIERTGDVPVQVAEYVQERIANLRREHEGQYKNISCIRTNSQKFLVHYFGKGQLQKLFFLFPVSRQGLIASCYVRPAFMFSPCLCFMIALQQMLARLLSKAAMFSNSRTGRLDQL